MAQPAVKSEPAAAASAWTSSRPRCSDATVMAWQSAAAADSTIEDASTGCGPTSRNTVPARFDAVAIADANRTVCRTLRTQYAGPISAPDTVCPVTDEMIGICGDDGFTAAIACASSVRMGSICRL